MRNKITGTLVGLVLILLTLCAPAAFGQVKFVDLPIGKKVVLKGQVRPGVDKFYAFDAKPGQTMTVRLITSNRRAVFDVDVVYNIRGPEIVSEAIVEGKTSWSGPLPDMDSDQFGIEVSTPAGRAAYRLEITLR